MKRSSELVLGVAAPAALILLLAMGWQWVAVNMISVLPRIGDMGESLRTRSDFYLTAVLVTIRTAAIGFGLGGVIALVLGVLSVRSSTLRGAVMPVVTMLHVTPIIAIAPALVVAFGFGQGPHVAVATIAAFFPMLINAISGLQAIDNEAAEVFRAMSASETEVFLRLRLPSSLPYLFAGGRVSVTSAMVGAVVSEFFGSADGLGAVITSSQANMDLVTMWCAILLSATVSLILLGLVGLAERLTVRW